jgi:anti-anti-sigma factor
VPNPSSGPDFSVVVVPGPAGGRTTVAVVGEVDLATAGVVADASRDALREGQVRLDLRDVTFMDSSGVRMLDALVRDCERQGWDLVVASEMRDSVIQILELTGMLDVLPLSGEEEGSS